jgi:hypothetical protein
LSISLIPKGDVEMETAILSSWKEIAAYLGKGLRTVQRWERKRGLPVRRIGVGPETAKVPIFAIRDEIDAWISSMQVGELQILRRENTELRERIAELKEEVRLLRLRFGQEQNHR